MPRRRRTGLALCLLLPALLAARPRDEEVDEYVAARMAKARIPGLSLAVVRGGRVVRTEGYGVADVELACPAKADTVYEIGSITKQFTATAVMGLVEEGKLGLDDPIGDHLGDLPEPWRPVTIRQLLNHTSGIKSYTSVGDFLAFSRLDHTTDEVLGLVRKAPLEFDPGAKWSYNNTGYYLLGLIVEKAAGAPFGAVLKARIFEPLGMDQTRPNYPKQIIPGRARGYGEVLGVRLNREPLTPTAAFSAGFLLSTVGDLAKWDLALRAGKPLRSSSFEQMYRPTTLKGGKEEPYGFGWVVERRLGHRVLTHGGGTPGFSSVIERYPDDDLTVIVLTNLFATDATGIARGVARLFCPELSVAAAPAIDDPEPDVTAKLRAAVERALAGEVDDSAFAPDLAKLLSSKAGRETTKGVAAAGPLKSLDLLARDEAGGGVRRQYRARFGDAVYLLDAHVAEGGQIDSLRLEKGE